MELKNQRKILLGVLSLFVVIIFMSCGSSDTKTKEVKKEPTYKTIDNVKYIVIDKYVENLIKDDIVKAEDLKDKKVLLIGKIDNIEPKGSYEYKITVEYDGFKRSVDLIKPDDTKTKEKLKKGNTITVGATFFAVKKGNVIDFADQKILSVE